MRIVVVVVSAEVLVAAACAAVVTMLTVVVAVLNVGHGPRQRPRGHAERQKVPNSKMMMTRIDRRLVGIHRALHSLPSRRHVLNTRLVQFEHPLPTIGPIVVDHENEEVNLPIVVAVLVMAITMMMRLLLLM